MVQLKGQGRDRCQGGVPRSGTCVRTFHNITFYIYIYIHILYILQGCFLFSMVTLLEVILKEHAYINMHLKHILYFQFYFLIFIS